MVGKASALPRLCLSKFVMKSERVKPTLQPSTMSTATPERPVEDDADDTASDEDFNPDAVLQDEDSSSSEDEAVPTASRVRKLKGKRQRDDDTIDVELDSGDEDTIQERRNNKRRKAGSDVDFSSNDEETERGFVRTRAQRKNEWVSCLPIQTSPTNCAFN